MNNLRLSIFCAVCVVVATVNLARGAPPTKEISREEVLAKVNGETVTVGRFYDFIKEEKTRSLQLASKEKTKDEILHELLRKILIQQRAASLNLDFDSTFVRRRNRHMRDFMLEYMYQKEIVDKTVVTDEEVKAHYESNLDIDFLIPEKVQVRDLLIRVKADSTQKDFKTKLKQADKEARKKIEALSKSANRGEDFAELCRQYSQAGVNDASANLGYIQRGQYSPEFDSAAFHLKEIKQISKPVKDSQGYHLIQLLDRKEKSYQPLDSTLFEGIREYLKNEKIQKAAALYVDSLRNATRFVYNWEVLNSPQILSLDTNTWVLVFGENDTILLATYLNALPGYTYDLDRDSLSEDDKKNLLVNSIAMPIILEKEARKKGYADLVEYSAEERSFTLQDAERRVIAERVNENFPPPTPEEILAYYQAHKIDFPPVGVPIHVYHIVFDDSLKAVKVLKQLKDGGDFVELAKKNFPGESEIKDVAYDLGFITQGEMPEEFYRAALNLKVGEVSQPVRTKWGFHLIKLVEKKENENTLTDLTPQITRAINLEKARKHIPDWENNLFTQSDVWINQKLLSKLVLPKPEG